MTTNTKDARVLVHLDTPENAVPPHPGPGWTRFVCISDTHSSVFRVPLGDVLLHAGDLSSYGSLSQLTHTINWLKSLDHPVKIMIAGNHDVLGLLCKLRMYLHRKQSIQHARAMVRNLASVGFYYLEHESLHFTSPSGKMWKVYGSPAAPVYVQGAFQYASPAEAKEIYKQIPEDTEILMTHTPPYRTLDRTKRGKNAGCDVLSSRLKELKHCRLHIFGHIHESAGTHVGDYKGRDTHRVSVNAAMPQNCGVVVVDFRD
ncbi:Metallo-dependent phosphatase-like protein [Scleroderma citrinum]